MNAQGEAGAGGLLAASPQSEAVTHELEELSLQPSQNLPPLNERKNGESTTHTHTPGDQVTRFSCKTEKSNGNTVY